MANKYSNIFCEVLARQQLKKPRRHPAEEEHRLQCACVQWFRLQHPDWAHLLFAVPNGGRRDKVTGGKLKAEGVTAGVSDMILMIPRGGFHAMCIEMKTPKGRQSQQQRQWQRLVAAQGYRYIVCRSVEEFISQINDYLQQ